MASFASSYIPTTSSTVTRNADTSTSATVTRSADTAQMTGSNFSSWYNTSGGSVFAEASANGASAVNTPIFGISDNTTNNTIESYAGDLYHLYVNAGGANQASLDAGGYVSNIPSKVAVAFANNSFAAVLNGGTIATKTSGSIPSVNTVNRLYIGNNRSGLEPLNGRIKRFAYYPARLTNAQLQNLTR